MPFRSRFFISFVFVILDVTCEGQYFQFSQYNFTSQRINPALIGTTRYATAEIVSRTQKTGGDFAINSNFISASYPLVNASTGRPWAGIGVSLLDDRSGGIFSTQEAALTYAVNVRLSRYQILSFGAKALYQSRRISMNGFYTGSQYVQDRGFDSSISSGEPAGDLRAGNTTFSSGVQWIQIDKNGQPTSYWGLSLFDINQREDVFLKSNIPLTSTFVLNGGFELYHYNAWAVFPEVLYSGNANNHVFNVGTRFQYDLQSPKDHLNLLTKYVPGRSGIIGLQLEREVFSLGASYDFPLFTTNAGNLGAFEIALAFKKLVNPKVKNRKRKNTKQNPSKPVNSGMVRRPKLKPVQKQNQTPTDSLISTPTPPEVEIVKTDTLAPNGNAEVGKIKSEPFLVEKITLRFHFEFNSIDLDDVTEAFLENLSSTLQDDPKMRLKITGHTDNIGNEKFNQRLSVKRAQTVKDYLVKKGIHPSRVEVDGKGLNDPIDTNDTEEGRSKNRRVEISVYRKN